MLIDFSISNFMSIRDKQTLSFEATNSTHLEEYLVFRIGKYRLLKINSIIGANASGKTNVLKGLYFFLSLILKPSKDKGDTFNYEPFLLDDSSLDTPSEISINFIAGEARYNYELSFDKRVIYKELLKCQPFDALREHKVFERVTDKETLFSTFKWGEKYRSSKNNDLLSINLLHNRTMFGAYKVSNLHIQAFDDIIKWAQNYFMPFIPSEKDLFDYVCDQLKCDEIKKTLLTKELIKADLGINDLVLNDDQTVIAPDLLAQVLDRALVSDAALTKHLTTNLTDLESTVELKHQGYQKDVFLKFNQESAGTQRYFQLSGLLLQLVQKPRFLAIDELDLHLHPDLVQHFISSYILNSTQSQFVFTSNFLEFLNDRDLYRDDCVWITEKSEQGATELFSLADFGSQTIRDTTNRYNAYRAGRLGGIPNLGSRYIQLDE